jgi:ribosome biogenesis GTPase
MAYKPRNRYGQKRMNKRALIHKARRLMRQSNDNLQEVNGKTKKYNSELKSSKKLKRGLIGRIAEVQKYSYMVMLGDTYIQCDVGSANIPKSVAPLVIGDSVVFDLHESKKGIIQKVLDRKTKISRLRADSTRLSEYTKKEQLLAANVDIVVIVVAAISPKFHPKLVDRYLVMCQYGNVPAAICMNKIDLVIAPPDLSVYDDLGIPSVFVSAHTHEGFEDLRNLIKGKYSVLTGHSGVGKSTITNSLLNKEIIETKEVTEKEGWGRYTTSVSTMHKWAKNSYIIDTPGIRSLGLWEIDQNSLRFYFPEFQNYYLNCKYSNCTHTHEPECAVKKAVFESKISKQRYESYIRMFEKG